MGIRVDTHIIIGYEIPSYFVFKEVVTKQTSCQHSNDRDAKFCSTCGKKIEISNQTSKFLTDKFLSLFDCKDEEEFYDEGWFNSAKEVRVNVEVVFYQCSVTGNSKAFIGKHLLTVGDPRDGDSDGSIPFPDVGTKYSVFSVAKDLGIPLDPMTGGYKMHVFSTAW